MHQNYDDDEFAFIRKQIESTRIALFSSEINSALQLPKNIIQVLKTADDGTIWFITSCNGTHAKSIERSFYASLDFYKKGYGCPLKLSGKAMIIEDDPACFPAEMSYSSTLAGTLVLIKMKISQAEYFETRPESVGGWKDKFKMAFYHLFLSTPNKRFNFS